MPKSKSKKRKLTHSQLNNGNKPSYSKSTEDLSHEEVWDDSALLRSWDEAVAEYEFYHSIHAKGEDVDEVLRKYDAANSEDAELAEEGAIQEEGEVVEDGEVMEEESCEPAVGENDAQTRPALDLSDERTREIPVPLSNQGPNLDESHLVPVDDNAQNSGNDLLQAQNQTLENIKMAYYWAGYYSGLYDGQKQALQAQQNTQNAPHVPTHTPTKQMSVTVPTSTVAETAHSEDGEV